MKDKKKVFLSVLKKHLERADKFESQVMELALNKKEGSRDDGWGVTPRAASVLFRLKRL